METINNTNAFGELVLEDFSSWSNKIVTVHPFGFADTMEISIDDITDDYHYFNLTREQVKELITFLQEQLKK
jgi:L-ribulose-5-phosphate 3-epimerase UlaE